MKTSLATASTLRLLVLAAVLAAACSSNADSVDSSDVDCQACASAGSGGMSTTALGGSSTSGSVGGAASPGGATAAGGATVSNSASTGGAATSAGGASTAPERCSLVTGTIAQTLVASGATLVDVRTASEFATDGLPGAINIPLADLATRMSELDKSKNIVVYCASGNRSGQATALLCDASYNVFNLGARSNWPQ